MKPNVRLVLVILFAMLLHSPACAFGWANGPDGADSFGTHDWIMYQAIVLSKATWIDTQTALFATDDPDSVFGPTDKPNHAFMPSGTYRGAPDTVANYYEQAVDAYHSGDYITASRDLGLLSHYYSDVLVPFHTATNVQSALHLQYELQVDRMTTSTASCPDWITPWSRVYVQDVRAKTIDAAMTSRAMFPALSTQYMLGGFDATTEMITRVLLSRAVNDLADIIQALPAGSGIPAPVKLSATISNHYPSIASPISLTANVLDSGNRPAQGVRVRFSWVTASSIRMVDAFTDPNGVARSYADRSQLSMGARVNVSASVPETQGAVGASVVKATWFVPTDLIGYTRAIVSTSYPAPNQTVTASMLVLNPEGQPIAGLPVTFSWNFKHIVYVRTAATGPDGIATNSRNVGSATRGHRVHVEASVQGGGTTRTSTASFVPQYSIGTMSSVVSTVAPAQNTKVTVSTTCLDPRGRPMSGVPVTFSWRFRAATWTATANTNSQGVARTTHDIKRATRTYPVYVTCTTPSGSGAASAMTWFIPR
jgi:hypothetical protein